VIEVTARFVARAYDPRVYGVIFDELEKFVLQEIGQTGLSRIHNLTGRGDQSYELGRTYPDDELGVIVRGLVDATGRPAEQIVEEFGVAMVPGLLEMYGFLVNPRWSFMEFLLNTEDVIHRGVKLHTPNAKPPQLQVDRAGPESVVVTYRSKRTLCPLAKGIIRGAAAHYRVEITLSEGSCMLRGDRECLITVSGEV
jgi:predicted hydrocarbon binding protein